MSFELNEEAAVAKYNALKNQLNDMEEQMELCGSIGPGDEGYEAIKLEIMEEEQVSLEEAEEMTVNVLRVRQLQLEEEMLKTSSELDELILKARNEWNKEFVNDTDGYNTFLTFSEEVDATSRSDAKRKADEEIDAQRILCPFCNQPRREDTAIEFGKYICKRCDGTWTLGKRHMICHSFHQNNTTSTSKLQDEDDEVHFLDDEEDTSLLEADRVNVFTKEDDDLECTEPVATFDSGAIRHKLGRVEPLLVTKLMDFQIQALQFALNAFDSGHGCCLALEMGMGKTLTTLALLDATTYKDKKAYVLVIAPPVIAINWEKEYDKWPLKHILLQGIVLKMDPGAKRLLNNTFRHGGLIISTLDIFRIHFDSFGTPKIVVIDEGHRIKNHRTQLFAAVNKVKTKWRVALTGTPLQNNLNECYTLLSWISPGLLGSQKEFQQCFCNDIDFDPESPMSKGRLFMLQEKIAKVVFRMNDQETRLPTKREYRLTVPVSLTDHLKMGLLERYNHALDTAMPQKIKVIHQMLLSMLKANKKVVVFSGRKKMLYELQAQQSGLLMVGETPLYDRQAMIDLFQNDASVQILYVSTMTGGQGINLTAASEVIIADASFNPTWETQAVARAWRIGQKSEVNVYRIIGAHTFEDSLYKQQLTKFTLFARLMDDKEIASLAARISLNLDTISLKSVDVQSLSKASQEETFASNVFQSISALINDITWHDFKQFETNMSFEMKQKAINDYHMVCTQYPRTLFNEYGEMVDVKPTSCFAGTLISPPPAPVLSNTVAAKFVNILPVLFAADIFDIEQECMETNIVTLQQATFKGIFKVTNCQKGTYRWRIRGHVDSHISPWSQWSAYAFIDPNM